uniref:Uncharacterized protein n=1 Tax=Chromera velia CCMP2878 TaxID=1169474 RepID=A0A0G4I4R1_9ALVE|eukprot:Cvel_10976.t1-p1 / transcript=Cvel_10976.t1 / gene=Cvel_10976 / organism=Chromera_velia_CCMP2878 / gene_product=hypothetical protein / transcript_product=hypothetical protein / location=Cvel_scaffold675:46653-50033(+) / protein_length=812 / sequence_SO=supercontig / SO=protein_coding / is_pseudo=false
MPTGVLLPPIKGTPVAAGTGGGGGGSVAATAKPTKASSSGCLSAFDDDTRTSKADPVEEYSSSSSSSAFFLHSTRDREKGPLETSTGSESRGHPASAFHPSSPVSTHARTSSSTFSTSSPTRTFRPPRSGSLSLAERFTGGRGGGGGDSTVMHHGGPFQTAAVPRNPSQLPPLPSAFKRAQPSPSNGEGGRGAGNSSSSSSDPSPSALESSPSPLPSGQEGGETAGRPPGVGGRAGHRRVHSGPAVQQQQLQRRGDGGGAGAPNLMKLSGSSPLLPILPSSSSRLNDVTSPLSGCSGTGSRTNSNSGAAASRQGSGVLSPCSDGREDSTHSPPYKERHVAYQVKEARNLSHLSDAPNYSNPPTPSSSSKPKEKYQGGRPGSNAWRPGSLLGNILATGGVTSKMRTGTPNVPATPLGTEASGSSLALSREVSEQVAALLEAQREDEGFQNESRAETVRDPPPPLEMEDGGRLRTSEIENENEASPAKVFSTEGERERRAGSPKGREKSPLRTRRSEKDNDQTDGSVSAAAAYTSSNGRQERENHQGGSPHSVFRQDGITESQSSAVPPRRGSALSTTRRNSVSEGRQRREEALHGPVDDDLGRGKQLEVQPETASRPSTVKRRVRFSLAAGTGDAPRILKVAGPVIGGTQKFQHPLRKVRSSAWGGPGTLQSFSLEFADLSSDSEEDSGGEGRERLRQTEGGEGRMPSRSPGGAGGSTVHKRAGLTPGFALKKSATSSFPVEVGMPTSVVRRGSVAGAFPSSRGAGGPAGGGAGASIGKGEYAFRRGSVGVSPVGPSLPRDLRLQSLPPVVPR